MLLFAALMFAQDVPCPAIDAALAAPLAGWTVPGERLEVGRPVVLDATGGAVRINFQVETAGRYGIALDQGGWIDVFASVSDGTPLVSVAHGHGPACSTIRKIVRFNLYPGVYQLALSRLPNPRAKVMLVAPD